MWILRRAFNAILKFARIVKWSLIFGDRRIAKIFINNSGPLALVQPGGTTLKLGDSVVTITAENSPILAYAWRSMNSLAQYHGVRWSNAGALEMKAEILGLAFTISTGEEANSLYEVFGERVYSLATKGPVHLVDIGVNIGATSLSFAIQPWVSQITGFEPFRPTFEKAQRHFEANPTFGCKVKLYNFGLAGSDREMVLKYSPTWKGSVGLRKPAPFVESAPDLRTEQIRLRKASDVFKELGVGEFDEKVVVKMDCEGAEYEIIEDLVKSGTIEKISALMIEWHDLGGKSISRALLESGFMVLQGSEGTDRGLGMIYAIRDHKHSPKPPTTRLTDAMALPI